MNRSALMAILLASVVPALSAAQRPVDGVSSDGAVLSARARDSVLSARGDVALKSAARTPRWMKAAVVGAVAGGLSFAALHWMAGDFSRNSMAGDVLMGAAAVGAGAGVLTGFYDWVCAPDSASDRAGLCAGLPGGVVRRGDSTRGRTMRR